MKIHFSCFFHCLNETTGKILLAYVACVTFPWDGAGPEAVSVPADVAIQACGQGGTSLSDLPRDDRNLGFYVKFLDVKMLAVTSDLVRAHGRYTNLCTGHTSLKATSQPPWASLSSLSPGPGFQLSVTISPALPGESLPLSPLTLSLSQHTLSSQQTFLLPPPRHTESCRGGHRPILSTFRPLLCPSCELLV